MWAIEHGLEPCMLSFISNVCLKYAPKWMVSSLIFQKCSGEGLTEPPPQTPPLVSFSSSTLSSGFALNSQALRAFDSGFALDSRALRALDSGLALNFRLENLVWPPKNKFMDPPLAQWLPPSKFLPTSLAVNCPKPIPPAPFWHFPRGGRPLLQGGWTPKHPVNFYPGIWASISKDDKQNDYGRGHGDQQVCCKRWDGWQTEVWVLDTNSRSYMSVSSNGRRRRHDPRNQRRHLNQAYRAGFVYTGQLAAMKATEVTFRTEEESDFRGVATSIHDYKNLRSVTGLQLK